MIVRSTEMDYVGTALLNMLFASCCKSTLRIALEIHCFVDILVRSCLIFTFFSSIVRFFHALYGRNGIEVERG